MIEQPNPELGILCCLSDLMNGHLTVHPGPRPGMLGIAVSDCDGDTAALLLDCDDRRALAAALLDGLDP